MKLPIFFLAQSAEMEKAFLRAVNGLKIKELIMS
jgi:hypothetical protein